MKLKFVFIGIIFLQLIARDVIGQIAITKNDTISIKNDSLVLKVNDHLGDVLWQFSKDAILWTDINNVKSDSLLISKIDSSGFYRAKISYGTCKPIFSDSTYVLRALTPLEEQKLKDDAGDIIKEAAYFSSKSGNTTIKMIDSTIANPTVEILSTELPDTIKPGWLLIDSSGIGKIILIESINELKSANGEGYTKFIKGIQVGIDYLLTNQELTYSSPTNRTKTEWDSPLKLNNSGQFKDFYYKNEQGRIGSAASVNTEMLTLKFDKMKLWEIGSGQSSLSVSLEEGTISIKPAIDFHIKYKPVAVATKFLASFNPLLEIASDYLVKGSMDNLKLITYNDLDFNFKYKISASIQDDLSSLIKPVKFAEYWYSIPAGPLIISVKTELIAQLTMEAMGEISLNPEIEWNNNLVIGVQGQDNGGNFDKNFIWNYNNKKSISSSIEGKVNLKERIEIIPRIEVYVMGIVGFSSEVIPYQQFTVNSAFIDNSPRIYDCSLDIGVDANASFDISAFHTDELTATIFKRDLNLLVNNNIYSLPYRLEYFSGNNQIGNSGQYLANPLSVKVFDSRNKILPNYPVFYDVVSGNGDLLSNFAISNSEGIAQNQWKLGDYDTQISKAYLKRPDQSIIERSIIEFQATKDKPLSLPTLTTNSISAITQTSATSGGNITSNGGSPITASGICWSILQDPTTATKFTTDGNGSSFFSNLTDLSANTTYFVWAYAINSAGTAYGNKVSFTTSTAENLTGTYTDSRDGHIYNWVQIGNQTWMTENLAYLPVVHPPTSGSFTESRYYVYDYKGNEVATAKQQANFTTYGVLYNWSAANAACPLGWHLPSDDEWKQLEITLGMTKEQADGIHWRYFDNGNQLMKASSGWNNNGNGTNSSGFNALPGGLLGYDRMFVSVGDNAFWWSSTERNAEGSWFRDLDSGFSLSRDPTYKNYGLSVRCLKDK